MKISTSAPAGRRRHLGRVAIIGAGTLLASGLSMTAAQAVACIANEAIVTITGTSVTEGNAGTSLLNFQLTRTGNPLCSTSVTAAVTPGPVQPATVNVDYLVPGDLDIEFTEGQTQALFSVPVIGDTAIEVNETIEVALTAGAPATPSIGGSPATGTITNDDPGGNPNPNPPVDNPPNNQPPNNAPCAVGSPNTGNNNRGFGNSGNNNRGNCNSGNNNRGDNNAGNNNRP